MIDTKIVFLAQLQAKLWPFKDLGVPPGGQISNPVKSKIRVVEQKNSGFLHISTWAICTPKMRKIDFLGVL